MHPFSAHIIQARHLRHQNIVPNLARQDQTPKEPNILKAPHQPPLPISSLLTRIPNGIHHPPGRPNQAQNTRRNRVLEPRDHHGGHEERVVLQEVGVPTLRAVEEVLGLVLWVRGGGEGVASLGVKGVGDRVGDACGFAEGAGAEAVPEADYDGGGCGKEDVTGAVLVLFGECSAWVEIRKLPVILRHCEGD